MQVAAADQGEADHRRVLPLVLAAAPEDRPRWVDEVELSLAGCFGLVLQRG